MKKKNINCVVLGSGFSSLVSTLRLIKNGYKPIVLDIGTHYLKKDGYSSILKPFFYKKKIEEYSFFGGLSEVWKGVVAISSTSDLKDLYIKDKKNLLDVTLNLIKDYSFYTNEPVNNKINDFNFIELNKNQVKKIFFSNQSWVGKPIFFCKKITGKKKIIPFETKSFFKDLIKSKKIKYINGEALKVRAINNYKYLFYKSKKNKINKLRYDFIFCGAGVLSSSRIINNSLNIKKNHINVNANQKGLFLTILKKKSFIDIKNSHPIYQGIIFNKGKAKIYIQNYLFSQILYNFLPRLLKSIFLIISNLNIFNYLSITFVSIDANSNVAINDNNEINIKKKKIDKNLFKILINRLNNLQKYFTIYSFGKFLPPLAGNHFGAIFSKKKNSLKLNRMGSVDGLQNFYIIDASSFNKVLCVPPTLISMMHSYRITNSVMKKMI